MRGAVILVVVVVAAAAATAAAVPIAITADGSSSSREQEAVAAANEDDDAGLGAEDKTERISPSEEEVEDVTQRESNSVQDLEPIVASPVNARKDAVASLTRDSESAAVSGEGRSSSDDTAFADDGETNVAALAAKTPPPAPTNLSVVSVFPRSVRLSWNFTVATGEQLDGYRIFYSHRPFEDVKTIKKETPDYELTGLEPFSSYEIWVRAIVNGRETLDSARIVVSTDVDEPSAPEITNATCYDTGSIFVAWRRPQRFFKSIDYYKLYYRPRSSGGDAGSTDAFRNVTIQATDSELQRFIIEGLKGGKEYVVRIGAATRSIAYSNRTWIGVASAETSVFLPDHGCAFSARQPLPGVEDGQLNAGMVVGAVCAVLFLLLACVGFVLWRKYFKSAYYYVDDAPRMTVPVGAPDWEEGAAPDGKAPGAVAFHDFIGHVEKLHADSDIGFAKEYEEIQRLNVRDLKDLHITYEQCSHPDNKAKNRYLNIVAYDHSRVQLSPLPGQKKTSDYINANFISGFQKYHAYIGTQGPLEETCEAFWRMVWEQNVNVIVMITNLMERGRRKCDMYWPKDESPVSYGYIEVHMERENVMANYIVRTLKIKHLKLKKKKGCGGERTVHQFHYTSWPDHGVPAHPLPVLTFVKKSSELALAPSAGPIVVHCSAGVGRTGTYIAIDSLLRQMRAQQRLNVFAFLRHIRRERNYLVQTEEQYVFIHDALVEALGLSLAIGDFWAAGGVAEVHSEDLPKHIEMLGTSCEDAKEITDEAILDRMFKLVIDFVPSDFNYLSAKKAYNADKNRNTNLLPIESSRVALAPKPGVEGSDYINASWMIGHRDLKEFIITQHPTKETRDAFWRMLWDHNAQTIVLLSGLNEEDGFSIFWPLLEEEFDLESFRVRYVEEAVHAGHSTFDFVLSSCQDDYELTVRVIHCSGWPHDDVSSGGGKRHVITDVFDVLRLVQDWHLEYQRGPLVVVDKFGGTEAAFFCALTTLCYQLELDDSIDVYQVAKLYHSNRPGIWSSKADILYLYKAMSALVASGHKANPVAHPNQAASSGGNSATASDGNYKHSSGNGVVAAGNGCSVAVQSASAAPERRHSSSDCCSNGSTGLNGADSGILANDSHICPETSSQRRHSLPLSTTVSSSDSYAGGNVGAPPEERKLLPSKENGGAHNDHEDDDEEEDEERISETAALTAS